MTNTSVGAEVIGVQTKLSSPESSPLQEMVTGQNPVLARALDAFSRTAG